MPATHDLIAKIQALPRPYKYVVTYSDGTVREVPAVSLKAAENGALRERRDIGRDLIERGTGRIVRVVDVKVEG